MYKLFAIPALALALAAPAFAADVTFANPSTITVVDGGETTSTIAVSGLGNVTGLTLSLYGIQHTYPDDLVIGVLNQSAGIGYVFMSGAGGSTDISGVNLTFSDLATTMLPESFVGGQITSGTYAASNYQGYEFTFFDNASSFLELASGTTTGDWTLYVDDVFPADGGAIINGWSMTFTTDDVTGAVPEPASWAMMLAGFGFAGGAMRAARRSKAKVTFA